MNHCIHGSTLNEYCPACELDVQTFEAWTARLDPREIPMLTLLHFAAMEDR